MTGAHLTAEELDDALAYRLDEERATHLRSCRGCQATVEWARDAKLGQLWNGGRDWAWVTMNALSSRARARNGKFVYAIPEAAIVSQLVRFRFERPPIIRFIQPKKKE